MDTSTEKEKMLLGLLYKSSDSILRDERAQAKLILKAYNDSDPLNPDIRLNLLKKLFTTSGDNLEIEPPFYCDYGYNISVGKNFYANYNCVFLDCSSIRIGDNVFLGPNVQIYTATHPLDPTQRNLGLESAKSILIGDNVWIGGSCIINPGVSIGSGSTIGSGSVITKDIPSNVLAAGNPCRVIRSL